MVNTPGLAARRTKSRLTQALPRIVEYAVHLLMCPAVPSSPVSFRKEMSLITTVSEVCGMELVASGLRQGFTFSTTVICRYFWLRFVPATKGRLMRVELSFPPGMICASGGYMNRKPYVMLVKVSQSPGTAGVGVALIVGGGESTVGVAVTPSGVMLGVGELLGSAGVNVGVGDEGGREGVRDGGSVGPETTISTNHGSFASGPIPKFTPLAFMNIQYPR